MTPQIFHGSLDVGFQESARERWAVLVAYKSFSRVLPQCMMVYLVSVKVNT